MSLIYYRPAKRLLDLLLAGPAFVLTAPLALVIAAVVRITMGSPILFRQVRPGLHERLVSIYKFRTMSDRCDENGVLLPDEKRLTRFGVWLRNTSLDELPQLINVIKGDLTLVGPRPLLVEYLPLYSSDEARRHNVRPGLAGWAQVNGRNALTWEEKFKLDVWYVDHCSFWLDMKILWMTLVKVLKREGISAAGHATMPEFMGSKESSRDA